MSKKVDDEVKEIQKRLAKGKASKGKAEGFRSWSISRYLDYKECPLKAKLKHLDKIEEPKGPALQRGIDIGRLAELFVKGQIKKLPDALRHFADEFKDLAAMYRKRPQAMVVEDSWGLTKAWGPADTQDWANCVLRVKVDVGYLEDKRTMVVIDWKTGKYRPEKHSEYVEQVELYCLTAMQLNEEVEEVQGRLCYLDSGLTFPEAGSEQEKELTFTRKDIPKLKAAWDKRTRAMLLDRSFAARPNRGCQWCHYRKGNTANLPGRKQLCRY